MEKHPTKIQTAQDVFGTVNWNPHFAGGFNSRVYGCTRSQTISGAYASSRERGWDEAEKMIQAGEIYSVHPFPHAACTGAAFAFGGTWACNSCNNDHLDKPWWRVRVMPDGDAWCVVGEGFQNLQESSNYAFGDTRQDALSAYAALMEGRAET